MEFRAGIEPTISVLQTDALPLGDLNKMDAVLRVELR